MKSYLLVFVVLFSGSRSLLAEDTEGNARVVYDRVAAPSGPTKPGQLRVTNSEPVLPGARVDIVTGVAPAHALVADVVVEAARWKIQDPSTMPKYPAEGFVTLTLSQNQWDSFLYKQDLRLVIHSGTVQKKDADVTAEPSTTGVAATVSPTAPVTIAIDEIDRVSISHPTPEYPVQAKVRHLTGTGVFEVQVRPDTGEVTKVTVAHSTGFPVLDRAATKTLERWKFRPNTVSRIKLPISFKM